MHSRRAFLRFLAASPILSAAGLSACLDPDRGSFGSGDAGSGAGSGESLGAHLLRSPDEAINVFDFREMARSVLPPAHYGYLATGVDDEETLRANREGFARLQLRPRRLVDVSEIHMEVNLFGQEWPTPIFLCPAGSQKAFHEEGEMAVTRAAETLGHLQILSTVTTTSVEDVNAVRARPVWFQLYPTADWGVTQALVGRVADAGCDTLVLTVDLPVGSNRETAKRLARLDPRDCSDCHRSEETVGPMSFPTGWLDRKPMFDGLEMGGVSFDTPSLTWDFIDRLRSITDMRILVKGIVRGDDARQAVLAGVDGVFVSNHGGRAEPSGRGTIESLEEVVAGVNGAVPVLIDGGIRRGSDILKALALGANAVGIGRPYLWGLASFGEPGVRKVLELLTEELRIAMQLNGVRSISRLDRSWVVTG
jgi:isopentenyl diphosphate isomerase/L-lactate dehydrogenase-like FMN-dependent dehydrogenase